MLLLLFFFYITHAQKTTQQRSYAFKDRSRKKFVRRPRVCSFHCENKTMLPDNIHSSSANFWVFTTYGDTGREWAVDTEHNSFGFGRQNG